MIYPPELLDRLQAIDPAPWAGTAYRHMFGAYQPDAENTRGARWNPSGTAAIYLGLTVDGTLAEAEHALASQPLRPSTRRTLYTVRVELHNVIDLSDRDLLRNDFGIGPVELAHWDMTSCRNIGGAVAWLGHDGLLVPSARSDSTNLVIYAANQEPLAVFEVQSQRQIDS